MSELKLLRRLHVPIDELEEAFECQDPEESWYFDTSTGAVHRIPDEAIRNASRGPDQPLSPRAARAVAHARRVLSGVGGRYLPIPQDDPADAWADMEAFVPDVDDPRLRRRLRESLRRKDAFRRFRILLHETGRLDDWYVFQQQRLRQRIVDWLATMGVGAWFED